LGHDLRVCGIGARQQQGKFFAPVARHEFPGALGAIKKNAGDLAQAGIAGEMALVVVVPFEMIDVDHQQ
jgi:hypothetical protein